MSTERLIYRKRTSYSQIEYRLSIFQILFPIPHIDPHAALLDEGIDVGFKRKIAFASGDTAHNGA